MPREKKLNCDLNIDKIKQKYGANQVPDKFRYEIKQTMPMNFIQHCAGTKGWFSKTRYDYRKVNMSRTRDNTLSYLLLWTARNTH